jgi:hypothetical protein
MPNFGHSSASYSAPLSMELKFSRKLFLEALIRGEAADLGSTWRPPPFEFRTLLFSIIDFPFSILRSKKDYAGVPLCAPKIENGK